MIDHHTRYKSDPPPWIDINADQGGLLARREIKRLLELEQVGN